jgi:hypothetical protein
MSSKIDWNKLDPELQSLYSRGLGRGEIAKQLGLSEDSVRHRIDKLKLTGDTKTNEPDNIDEEFCLEAYRKIPENPSFDQILDGLVAAQGFQEQFNIGDYSITRKIRTETPIIACFWSDLHIGSPSVDYSLLKAHKGLIQKHKNIYLCLGGDGWDGFLPSFKNSGAVAAQLVSPQIQMLGIRQLLKELHDKVISICGGNHNDFLVKKTGVDANRFVLDGMKFPYLPNGGLIKLTVGKQTYKIIQKHHWGFNSRLNQFNTHHRIRDFLYSAADIVVTEHEHNPGMETQWVEEYDTKRQVVNVRTGTYKIGDPYSRRLFKDGVPGPECLVLFPDRKKIVGFDGVDAIEDALRYTRR